MCLSGAHYTIEDVMKYTYEYWYLDRFEAWDVWDVTVEATDEMEALELAKLKAHRGAKKFKLINKDTKIIFVRNRIPRALIKSKIKPKASLVALGGGYYATGTDNLKRLLENLPKKLYYSDHQPSSWDWHDHVIIKL